MNFKKFLATSISAVLLMSAVGTAASGDITLLPTDQETPWRECVPSEKLIDGVGTIDGWDRTWKEYVPASYDGKTAVPLVVVLHGGSSHTAHKRTTFHLIADRENFIVLYPESIAEGTSWNVWNLKTAEDGMPNDITYIDELIAMMQLKYNIDSTRLYITGQSMGDMMCSTYIYEHADMFAACAPLSGPTFAKYLVDEATGDIKMMPKHQAPVVRTHGTIDSLKVPDGTEEDNQHAKREAVLNINNNNWIKANNCSTLPLLGTEGDKCLEIYEGDQPFFFYSVEGGAHNPVLDMADYIWTHFFSNYQRVNGKVIYTPGEKAFKADKNAVAITANSAYAYVNNQLVDLGASCVQITETWNDTERSYLTVPVTFLEKAFPGSVVTVSKDGRSAVLSYNGKTVEFAEGWRLCVINNSVKTIGLVDVVDGVLMIPFADVANNVYGIDAVERYNVVYAVDHDHVVTYDFAYAIRQVLGTQTPVSNLDALALENDPSLILQKQL